ncbi:MAG: FAD/NAD-binding family oxidoreductase [Syntrophales bacterium]
MITENVGQNQDDIWKIEKVVAETNDIYTVYLKGPAEKFAGRKAGQFLTVSMPGSNGWSQAHPFTISCAPEDSLLSLTIRKQGAFTSAIPDLKPGTPLKCMGPFGFFCKDIDSKPSIVMMAGGVGVTPFLSVLRHFKNTNSRNNVALFWVNKTIEEVFRLDEINEMTQNLDLTVVHCLSRENDAQRYFKPLFGRVRYETGRLSADILKRHGVTKDAAFYLCGPPPMMESALKQLGVLQVDQSAVAQESFTRQ